MSETDLLTIGWREWVRLPDLGIRHIKAKVDTGARSSSLHAVDIETFECNGITRVRFKAHPRQHSYDKVIECEAEVLEFRSVRSSTGHSQQRPVIQTTVGILGQQWPIELTLASRDAMGFRMLLGREAFRGRCLVDAGQSYFGGKPRRKKNRNTQEQGNSE